MENNYQNPQNNYYQNLYNMFGGRNPVVENEMSEIRHHATNAGIACLAFVACQYLFVFILQALGLSELYYSNPVFEYGLGIFGQILYVFVPFFGLYLVSPVEEKNKIMFFDKPKSKKLFVLACFIGLSACLISSFLSEILLGFFSLFGIEFTTGLEDTPVADSPLGYFFTLLSIAVVAPLVEEFAFRCVLLQPLRKYGDKFAIIISSILFGLMHGNMVQAPAAAVIGLVLGYLCIKTGTVWTSMAIHMFNNLISSLLSFYYEKHPDANDFPLVVILVALTLIGIAAIPFFKKEDKVKLKNDKSAIEAKQKRNIFLCVPTVVVPIVNCVYSTLLLQNTSSALGLLVLVALIIVLAVFAVKHINAVLRDNRFEAGKGYRLAKAIVIIAAVFNVIFVFGSVVLNNVQ